MAAYNQGTVAKLVIGIGTQTEQADRTVTGGTNGVTYCEKLDNGPNAGKWTVDLSDGSQWLIPAETNPPTFNLSGLYNWLNNNDQV